MSRTAQGTAGERALLEPGAHTSLQGLGIWADSAHPVRKCPSAGGQGDLRPKFYRAVTSV